MFALMKFKIIPENLLERIALWANLAPTPLVETQAAFTMARAIMAASNTGVLEALGKQSRTVEEVASASGTDVSATKHLLNMLVSIGYVSYSSGRYALRPKYQKWLLKDSSSNLVGKMRFQIAEWNWVAYMEEFVRTGKPLDFHQKMSAQEWADYQVGMRDLSINTAKEFGGKLKLPSHATHMLDIGGSHGLYSIELCRKNPELSSTILELPGAVDQASAIAAKEGMADRVKYRTGNALTDDLGEALYDLVMINNVVHHFNEEQNLELARRVHGALKPGGLYGIGEFIRRDTPSDGDVIGAMGSLYFALTSASGTWSEPEIRGWQTKAGLKAEKSISLMALPGWKMVLARK
jgi:2-polyprenyl-3-methyl-5-hydroxy-6-metoxy-1,4-benzoquinol methylase